MLNLPSTSSKEILFLIFLQKCLHPNNKCNQYISPIHFRSHLQHNGSLSWIESNRVDWSKMNYSVCLERKKMSKQTLFAPSISILSLPCILLDLISDIATPLLFFKLISLVWADLDQSLLPRYRDILTSSTKFFNIYKINS